MTIDELRARMREAAVAVENAGDDLGLFSERHGEFQRLASPANVKALDAEITRLREDLDRVARERDEARGVLTRCRTILGNMAKENEGAIFYRWPISHEPLRADARHLLPIIDEAITKELTNAE